MGNNTFPCNPYPISTEELNKGNNDGLNTRVAALESEVTDLNTDKANKADIATEFSDLTNYNSGDLVYYEGALYEFQVDHTAGAWETSEVIQKDLSDIVTTLKSGLTGLVKTYTLTNASSGSGGIISTGLPNTAVILDAVFVNYILIPYRAVSDATWGFVVTDIDANGAIITQKNKTNDLLVHYI